MPLWTQMNDVATNVPVDYDRWTACIRRRWGMN